MIALGQAGTHAEPQSRREISGRHPAPVSAPPRLCVRFFEITIYPASKETEGSTSEPFTVNNLNQLTGSSSGAWPRGEGVCVRSGRLPKLQP